ncbi:MAG: 2Fe-2S iron-sulfur cluster-binding protein [Pseudomonadota bacterium]
MSRQTKHRVSFTNRDWPDLEVGQDEAIIDAVEAAGYALPVACRYGGCITCAARLLEGNVKQPNGTAINRRQSQEGYVLLCVARPKADCVIEVGVESHDTLYLNPFEKPNQKSLEFLQCLQSK